MGEYSKDIETCTLKAAKEQGLSINLWYLLSLAVHWMNDATAWAKDVLAGRNIYECLNDTGENSDITPAYSWKCPKCGLETSDALVPAGHVCHIADAKEEVKPSGGIPFGEVALQQEVKELKARGDIPCCERPAKDK